MELSQKGVQGATGQGRACRAQETGLAASTEGKTQVRTRKSTKSTVNNKQLYLMRC